MLGVLGGGCKITDLSAKAWVKIGLLRGEDSEELGEYLWILSWDRGWSGRVIVA